MSRDRVKVCTFLTRAGKSCPNLAEPGTSRCSEHPGRPRNASWSTDRDPAAQRRFRNAVLERDGHRCQRCGHHDPTGRTLEAHHVRPGYNPSDGKTLCTKRANGCHSATDAHAR
jgi:hypothetical protein